MTDKVLRSDAGGLCTLTLNRPDKLNALDTELFEELDAHLAALEAQTDRIGCVVLRGAGRGFCAGADLGAVTTTLGLFKPKVIERLQNLPQPTIAAVHGVCFTGALELALACDFIVAEARRAFRRYPRQMGPGRRLGHVAAPAAPHRRRQGQAHDVHRAHRRGGGSARRSGWSTCSPRRAGWTRWSASSPPRSSPTAGTPISRPRS